MEGRIGVIHQPFIPGAPRVKIIPKNWRDFQHYKDRNPPWIRLHKGLLDNFDFQRLPVASRALAPMLWLLASDSIDGTIDADPEVLSFRLRMSVVEVVDALAPLMAKGFFESVGPAIEPLAERLQAAGPEAEAEALQKKISSVGDSDGFEEFWKAYPAYLDRKAAKPQCLAKWKSRNFASIKPRILSALKAQKASDKWQDEGGKWIPAPLVWLNQERWTAVEEAKAESPWWQTRRGCEEKAAEIGIPKWSETEPFAEYQDRVRCAADQRQEQAA